MNIQRINQTRNKTKTTPKNKGEIVVKNDHGMAPTLQKKNSVPSNILTKPNKSNKSEIVVKKGVSPTQQKSSVQANILTLVTNGLVPIEKKKTTGAPSSIFSVSAVIYSLLFCFVFIFHFAFMLFVNVLFLLCFFPLQRRKKLPQIPFLPKEIVFQILSSAATRKGHALQLALVSKEW